MFLQGVSIHVFWTILLYWNFSKKKRKIICHYFVQNAIFWYINMVSIVCFAIFGDVECRAFYTRKVTNNKIEFHFEAFISMVKSTDPSLNRSWHILTAKNWKGWKCLQTHGCWKKLDRKWIYPRQHDSIIYSPFIYTNLAVLLSKHQNPSLDNKDNSWME